MNDVWAIIPARGGSKGVPGKNIKLLGGVPLIAHAIRAARTSRRVTEVFVSTDDPGIAEVARAYGASVIDRPAELSGDTATSESAVIHALESLRTTRGHLPTVTVFMQCTSPFTTPEDVDATVGLVTEKGADSAFVAMPFHGFLWRKGEDDVAIGINHDSTVRLRRQDRPPEFRETGAVYAFKTREFLVARHRFFGETRLHVVPDERGIDIDSPADFVIAEALFTARI